MTPKKFTPPDEALPNFGRALRILANEIAKLPKEEFQDKPEMKKSTKKGA